MIPTPLQIQRTLDNLNSYNISGVDRATIEHCLATYCFRPDCQPATAVQREKVRLQKAGLVPVFASPSCNITRADGSNDPDRRMASDYGTEVARGQMLRN